MNRKQRRGAQKIASASSSDPVAQMFAVLYLVSGVPNLSRSEPQTIRATRWIEIDVTLICHVRLIGDPGCRRSPIRTISLAYLAEFQIIPIVIAFY